MVIKKGYLTTQGMYDELSKLGIDCSEIRNKGAVGQKQCVSLAIDAVNAFAASRGFGEAQKGNLAASPQQ